MGLFIIYFKGSQVEMFKKSYVLQSLKIVHIIAKSEDPDEMQQTGIDILDVLYAS